MGKTKRLPEADPNNDEFNCEFCGKIHDIEDSIQISTFNNPKVLVCEICSEFPRIGVLDIYGDGDNILSYVVDEKHDFPTIFKEFNKQDDPMDPEWQAIIPFLQSKGVTVISPVSIDNLNYFYE